MPKETVFHGDLPLENGLAARARPDTCAGGNGLVADERGRLTAATPAKNPRHRISRGVGVGGQRRFLGLVPTPPGFHDSRRTTLARRDTDHRPQRGVRSIDPLRSLVPPA